jgi:nucleoid-associated protein YgaU
MRGRHVTREQKLGLIVGFSVVLLLGVLLADHLSRARTEQLYADDAPDGPLVIPSVDVPPLAGAEGLPTPTLARGGMESGFIDEPAPVLTPTAAVTEPTGDGPAGFDLAQSPTVGDVRSIFDPVRALVTPPPSQAAGAAVEPRPAVVLPGFVPVDDDGSTAARELTHTVKSGETLFAISSRYYGNGHLWRDLARHNAGLVGDNGMVGIGVVLRIPPRPSLAGQEPPAAAQPQPRTVAASDGMALYKVREGDTLSEISQKLLGTVKRMNELITMNSDKIRDADDIRVGMELRYRRGPAA